MVINAKRFFATFAVGALALSIAGSPALAQQSKPAKAEPGTAQPEKKPDGEKKSDNQGKKGDKQAKGGVAIGAPAPQFTLTDIAGKQHTLADLTKEGKIVVLQWFNPDCPFVVKHYENAKTFNEFNAKYQEKGVVLLAVNSSAPGLQGSGKDRNAKAKKDWNITYPILLDESGEIGRAYGAKNTPAMYVIAKDGTLAYKGAIDDEPGAGKVGKTNYVAKAVDELLANTNVTTTETRPYGCSVKYKDQ